MTAGTSDDKVIILDDPSDNSSDEWYVPEVKVVKGKAGDRDSDTVDGINNSKVCTNLILYKLELIE